MRILKPFLFLILFLPLACSQYDYDIVIENGTVYDGT